MKMKHKNVLCIYPYRIELGKKGWGFCPPLGLECIAASIKEIVDKITIVDMRFEDTITEFINDEIDLVCISKNWDFEEDLFCEILNKTPEHIMTIIGGRNATENVIELFNNHANIDVIIRGDGEETIRELFESGSPRNISGLSYRENGKIIHNQNRLSSSISDTIYPDRKLRRYKYKIKGIGTEFDTISGSRGCPFNCKFCTLKLNPYGMKREWSGRSPESVIAEIKTINADLIGFTDENLTHDMDRMGKICDLILKEKIKKKFIANARIDIAKRPDVLSKMYKAGFRVLLLGIESTCDETLKFLNKGFTTSQVKEAFRTLRKFGIFYHGYFIIGNIGEDEEDMLRISEFAREIGLDSIALCRLRVDKYSPLRETIKKRNDYHIGEDARVYSNRYSVEKLGKITNQINYRFYGFFHILRALRKLFAGRIVTPWIMCYLVWCSIISAGKRRLRRRLAHK
jgi:radical SAM superfamily enzyme YgiQ (UPF0313 family)